MTIATAHGNLAIFLVKGWTRPCLRALAITIGGIVCIAASNAGIQVKTFKTGYLIGATPWKQQLSLMIGVIICTFSIGATLNAMNNGLESFQRLAAPIPITQAMYTDGVQDKGPFSREPLPAHQQIPPPKKTVSNGHSYTLLNAIGSSTLPDGKYLLNTASNQIEIQWTQGIGSEKGRPPKAADGHRHQRHPHPQAAWGLVLLGVALVIGRTPRLRSPISPVGAYLSIRKRARHLRRRLMRWMVDRAMLHHTPKSPPDPPAYIERLIAAQQEILLSQPASGNTASPLIPAEPAQHERMQPPPGFLEAHPSSCPLGLRPHKPRSLSILNRMPVPPKFRHPSTPNPKSPPAPSNASGLIPPAASVGLIGVCVKLYEAATEKSIPRFSRQPGPLAAPRLDQHFMFACSPSASTYSPASTRHHPDSLSHSPKRQRPRQYPSLGRSPQ